MDLHCVSLFLAWPRVNMKPLTVTVIITTDDSRTLFVNGSKVIDTAYVGRSTITEKLSSTPREHVQQVFHTDFMLQTSSGVVSDRRWKCVNYDPGFEWYSVKHYDSKGPNAVENYVNSLSLQFQIQYP